MFLDKKEKENMQLLKNTYIKKIKIRFLFDRLAYTISNKNTPMI